MLIWEKIQIPKHRFNNSSNCTLFKTILFSFCYSNSFDCARHFGLIRNAIKNSFPLITNSKNQLSSLADKNYRILL